MKNTKHRLVEKVAKADKFTKQLENLTNERIKQLVVFLLNRMMKP